MLLNKIRMSNCNPCPFVSGAFGLVPKDASYTSIQSKSFLTQEGIICNLDACDLTESTVQDTSILLTMSESQGVDVGPTELVNFDTVVEGSLQGFDTTTHLFTPPVSGNYAFNYQLSFDTDNNNRIMLIRRNEPGDIANLDQFVDIIPGSFAVVWLLSAVLYCVEGEPVGFRVQTQSGVTGIDNGEATGIPSQLQISLLTP